MPPRDAGNVDAEEKTLKNKPKASKLRQQKLPAWQPILTASTVIPTIFCVGIIFIPVGIALYLAADSVIETKLDYTDCTEFANGICNIDFTVSKDMEGDVFAYYYLENYYQNHRRYVKSRNDEQYLGNVDKVTDCAPFDYAEDPLTKKKLPIAPCGAVANSMFNDTFSLTYTDPRSGLPVAVPFTSNGVLWDVDIQKKFKNPTSPDGNLCTAFKDTIRPPNWSKNPCDNGGFENVDFIVWMRTAALPNFRKLWRLVDRSSNNDLFRRGLPKGNYKLTVTNNYPVKQFEGRKGFLLSTSSWAGGRNSFLGIAYLVVGCLAIALGVIFIVIHIKFGHSLHDMTSVPPAHQ